MGLPERGLTIFALVQIYTFESNFFVFVMVFQSFLYLMNLKKVLKYLEALFFIAWYYKIMPFYKTLQLFLFLVFF